MVSWARSEVKRETKNQGKGFKDYPIDVNLFTKVPTPPDSNQNFSHRRVLVPVLPNLESCCASDKSPAYFVEC